VAGFEKTKIFPFDQHIQFFKTTFVRHVLWRTILNSGRKGIWSGCWRNFQANSENAASTS